MASRNAENVVTIPMNPMMMHNGYVLVHPQYFVEHPVASESKQ